MDSQNQHEMSQTQPSNQKNENFSYKLWNNLKENLSFKSKWDELNGAMGDLGTFIPIILALTLSRNLDLGTTLIFTGVYNIIIGAVHGVPMPVQPMKVIASVAISNPDFGVPEIMAAGICTNGILFVLSVTQLMQLVYWLLRYCRAALLRFPISFQWLMPLCVVRGIQLSQGLSFAMCAVKYLRSKQDFVESKSLGDRPWLGLNGLLLVIICACFIILVNRGAKERENNDHKNNDGIRGSNADMIAPRNKGFRRVLFAPPSAFIIVMLGVILAIVCGPKEVGKGFKFGPSSIHIVKISKQAWIDGFFKATIPQLFLSILNSVIVVSKLSSDLFPQKDFTSISLFVTAGMMNFVGCWFGAMPTCHGAGSLAGQYKFRDRSGASVALVGAAKLIIGIVLGSSIIKILDQFPVGVLGVLLLFAVLEVAMACRDMNTKESSFVMLLVTAVSLGKSRPPLGFLCGIITHFLLNKLRIMDRLQSLPALWKQKSQ